MLLRFSRSLFPVAVITVFFLWPGHLGAQGGKLEAPLQLPSIEWLVADSGAMVRGIVVDVAADQHWNIVTLQVRETIKGAKTERLKFALHRYDIGDAALAKWKQSQRELLWVLKQSSGKAGEAPDREKLLARHKIDLYAPFFFGSPAEIGLPVIPLGEVADDSVKLPTFLNVGLRPLKSAAELEQAIRSAAAEPRTPGALKSYAVSLPPQIAERTGLSRARNMLIVPVDHRIEEAARKLVQSPGDFLGKNEASHKMALRLEGVKALRLFPSEQNFAIVRAWLDDPASAAAFKSDRKATPADLVPAAPKTASNKAALPARLIDVPEIHFQKPLTKAMQTEDAQLHTAVTIDSVQLLNQKKIDGFIDTLMRTRPDLGGLPFAMGDACRMKPEASKQFVAALDVFHKAPSEDPKRAVLIDRYMTLAAQQKIDPSASVASLMQVLGHEEVQARVDLVWYLDTLAHADATRALAKLAIFSNESEVSTAAVNALKKRDKKDYTEILLSGLDYPWPAVAERAGSAIASLGRKDLIPQLIDVLEKPDPRAPRARSKDAKEVAVVRELVRLNHHHSCLLCHAPAPREKSDETSAPLEGLTAQVPVPSESMTAYYRPSVPDILVRFDTTYLRQDFSMKIAVPNADPWPEMQRYDFLVRTREVSEEEAAALQKLLQGSQSQGLSPYQAAALSALRALTGRSAEPTAEAWRKVAGL